MLPHIHDYYSKDASVILWLKFVFILHYRLTSQKDDIGIHTQQFNALRLGLTVLCLSTAGSVILESPVHPVPEGTPVTLRCLTSHKSNKLGVVTPVNQSCSFSRDGRLIGVSLTGEMRFAAVNRSYEGLYKCIFSGVESPGSWLAVRGELCLVSTWWSSTVTLKGDYGRTSLALIYLNNGFVITIKQSIYSSVMSALNFFQWAFWWLFVFLLIMWSPFLSILLPWIPQPHIPPPLTTSPPIGLRWTGPLPDGSSGSFGRMLLEKKTQRYPITLLPPLLITPTFSSFTTNMTHPKQSNFSSSSSFFLI